MEEHELPKTTKYKDQEPMIKSVLKNAIRFTDNPDNIFFAMDWSQKANAELLMSNNINVDFRVVYTWWSQVVSTKIHNEYRVPKKLLIETVKTLFDNDLVEIVDDLKKLQKEMDYFQTVKTPSGGTTYEGAGEHDDYVNAMVIALYYMYQRLWVRTDVLEFMHAPNSTGKTRADARLQSQKRLHERNKKKDLLEHNTRESKYFNKYVY